METDQNFSLLPLLAAWLVDYDEVGIQMSLCETISRVISAPVALILGCVWI